MELSQSTALNTEILQVKKSINYFSSVSEIEKSQKFQSINSKLADLLNELIIQKRDLDENNELNQKYKEKVHLNGKLVKDKLQQEYTLVMNEHERCQNELYSLKENIEKISNISQFENESRNQILKHQTHESQMNIIKNDYKLTNQIKQAESTLVNYIEKYSKLSSSTEELFMIKYFIFELLHDVKIIDKSESKNCNFETNYSNWYDIIFKFLPDDVLDFENNNENHPLMSKSKKNQLSKELLDKYRAIFKKRRKMNSKNLKGPIVLNEIDDFQAMVKSYLPLLCFVLSKQEIVEAKKQFALDWIEGSHVLTILINSKSSKMATIVLPKNYPLCDKSLIKLISLSGYTDSDIKNFKIGKNVENLSEWISELTNLYNTNQIILQ